MLNLDSVLIVDPSKVMRHALKTVFRPHAQTLHTAANLAEAMRFLRMHESLSLVLCESQLPDGDGFELLGFVTKHAPGAKVILMTTAFSALDSRRARADGALACLPKPISMSQIDRAWNESLARSNRQRHRRVDLRTPARLVDDGGDAGLLAWTVHNLSESGAFIETTGPLPVGRTLEIEIGAGERRIRATSTVVRVQEPSWLYPGGIGVCFEEMDPASRATLATWVGERIEASEPAAAARPRNPGCA